MLSQSLLRFDSDFRKTNQLDQIQHFQNVRSLDTASPSREKFNEFLNIVVKLLEQKLEEEYSKSKDSTLRKKNIKCKFFNKGFSRHGSGCDFFNLKEVFQGFCDRAVCSSRRDIHIIAHTVFKVNAGERNPVFINTKLKIWPWRKSMMMIKIQIQRM